MFGEPGGTQNTDDEFAKRSFENIVAWIMGRNMFGPVRGPWQDESWKGWWGDNPPFHAPVFVLTNHPRASFTMEGNTTFHFVTDGIHEALARAKDAAGGKDIRIGGGVATVRQYLQADLIDEMHLVLSHPPGSGRSASRRNRSRCGGLCMHRARCVGTRDARRARSALCWIVYERRSRALARRPIEHSS